VAKSASIVDGNPSSVMILQIATEQYVTTTMFVMPLKVFLIFGYGCFLTAKTAAVHMVSISSSAHD